MDSLPNADSPELVARIVSVARQVQALLLADARSSDASQLQALVGYGAAAAVAEVFASRLTAEQRAHFAQTIRTAIVQVQR